MIGLDLSGLGFKSHPLEELTSWQLEMRGWADHSGPGGLAAFTPEKKCSWAAHESLREDNQEPGTRPAHIQ